MRNRTMEDYLERVHLENERLRKVDSNRQRVIDRARAVAASWEQHACGGDPITATFVILGMQRLIDAIDIMDANAISASSSPESGEDG